MDKTFFAGRDTVFYCEDLETGSIFAVNGKRIEERHPPFSTFKIPNLLIALETDTASGLEHKLPYDPVARPKYDFWPEDWAQDQTLESAFRRSAAWAFRDLAKQMGEEVYAGYLDHFHYGNLEAKGDAFWLDRTLQISPKEQVDFLRRLLTKQLEVAPLNIDNLREVALLKKHAGIRLYGKTGSGPVKADDFDGEFEGWFVGWLERPTTAPVLFALWTRGQSYSEIKNYRLEASEQLLEQAGFLPLDWP